MAKVNKEKLNEFVNQINQLTDQFAEDMQKYDDFPEEMTEGDFWEQWEAFISMENIS